MKLPYKGGGVAIFQKMPDGNYAILLGKRTGRREHGKWSIPGGEWKEEDKTLADTAKRECSEEILNERPFQTIEVEYNAKLLGKYNVKMLLFTWTTIIYEIDPMFEAPTDFCYEFSELKFIPLSELKNYTLAKFVNAEVGKFKKLKQIE